MGKRKGDDDGDVPMGSTGAGEESDGSEELDVVNVDFEMFDPQPAVDFHGLKTLLRQLFGDDSTLFDLSALTELILAQPLLGTTVKVDGNESDPYAFLTVINMNEHKENPAIKSLTSYILSKSESSPVLHARLKSLLGESAGTAKGARNLGLILTERLINLPTEIVPPMYAMLQEEIEWALEEGEPYSFEYFLVLSKTYIEVASRLDELENRPFKKGKKKAGKGAKEDVFYFHAEDELVRRRAGEENVAGYEFENKGDEGREDAKRAFSEFGIRPKGLMMLIPKDEYANVVEDLKTAFPG